MTLVVQHLCVLVVAHFIADFVLQSHWMASNKSKDLLALISHVLVYYVVLLIVSGVVFGQTEIVLLFVMVNTALHFIVDLVTSKITAELWKRQELHWFFVVIGFDQMVHYLCLFVTYAVLINN